MASMASQEELNIATALVEMVNNNIDNGLVSRLRNFFTVATPTAPTATNEQRKFDQCCVNLKKLKKQQLQDEFTRVKSLGIIPETSYLGTKTMPVLITEIQEAWKTYFNNHGRSVLTAPMYQSAMSSNTGEPAPRRKKRSAPSQTTPNVATDVNLGNAGRGGASNATSKKKARVAQDARDVLHLLGSDFCSRHHIVAEIIPGHTKFSLRCELCNHHFNPETLQKNNVNRHCGEGCLRDATLGLKHKRRLEAAKEQPERDAVVIKMYREWVEDHQMSEPEILARYAACHDAMKTGTPFTSFDTVKESDRRNQRYSMPGTRSMEFVRPAVFRVELEKLRKELGPNAKISITFDGTTRIGEVLCIVFKFILDGKLVRRLVALPCHKHALDAGHLAGAIHAAVVACGIPCKNVLFTGNDRCAVNGAALTILQDLGDYVNLVEGPCVSHTFNNCGDSTLNPKTTFNPEGTDPFLLIKQANKLISSCLKNSTAFPAIFKEVTGEKLESGRYSVRWSCLDDCDRQLLRVGMDNLLEVARKLVAGGHGKISSAKLLLFLEDDATRLAYGVELACQLAFNQPTRHVTYYGEAEKLVCFEIADITMDVSIDILRERGSFFVYDDSVVIQNFAAYMVWKEQDIISNPSTVESLTILAESKKKYDDAVTALKAGPKAANGRPMRLNQTFNGVDAVARKAAHAAEFILKKEALERTQEMEEEKYIKEKSKNGPVSIAEYKILLETYFLPTVRYTLSFLDGLGGYYSDYNRDTHLAKDPPEAPKEGALVEVMKLFDAFKICNPNPSRVINGATAAKKLDYIFENVPYLKKHEDKVRWLANLKTTFPAIQQKHITNLMSDRLVIGSTCHVSCAGYAVPRVGRVTFVGADTYNIKYLGDSFKVEQDETEDAVIADRVTPLIECYLEYYYNLGRGYEDWVNLVEILVLLAPSSASAERVFSQLAQMFTKQQMSLNQRWIFTCIALRFNKRRC